MATVGFFQRRRLVVTGEKLPSAVVVVAREADELVKVVAVMVTEMLSAAGKADIVEDGVTGAGGSSACFSSCSTGLLVLCRVLLIAVVFMLLSKMGRWGR